MKVKIIDLGKVFLRIFVFKRKKPEVLVSTEIPLYYYAKSYCISRKVLIVYYVETKNMKQHFFALVKEKVYFDGRKKNQFEFKVSKKVVEVID